MKGKELKITYYPDPCPFEILIKWWLRKEKIKKVKIIDALKPS